MSVYRTGSNQPGETLDLDLFLVNFETLLSRENLVPGYDGDKRMKRLTRWIRHMNLVCVCVWGGGGERERERERERECGDGDKFAYTSWPDRGRRRKEDT